MSLAELNTARNVAPMEKWNELAKARMKELKLTQEKLAESLGVTQGAIAHWMSGRREPDLATINAILTKLALPTLQIARESRQSNIEIVPSGRRQIAYPVISMIAAGEWAEAVESHPVGFGDEYLSTDYEGSGMCFWAKVKGDSMTSNYGPSFPDGSYVLVDTGLAATPGALVVAKRVQDGEATFKRLVEDAGRQYLRPLNPAFEMLPIDEETRIIGVVKEMRQKL
ncbi:S24 family peptidase [Pseudomonas oryzihabitans]|uniref:LexA family protein n=1 Tax=Pseudomonas oryzihabitans TaxID=47885 RepID=UPI002895497C|nr:S24 family peptidase [Pseudomonas oryzihabitans]MDT3718466.1 S24 family peptidase [Pseudomonas oryzihabitans]